MGCLSSLASKLATQKYLVKTLQKNLKRDPFYMQAKYRFFFFREFNADQYFEQIYFLKF